MIVTVTVNPAIDKSASVDRVLPEHKLRCSEPVFEPGGGGLNVSRAVRQLGGESLALWTQGGSLGQLLAELLDDLGLAHRPLPIAAMNRENLIVYERSSGEQYRFGMPGPRLTDGEGDACLEQLASLDPPPEFLVLSGSLSPGLPDDFYARASRKVSSSCHVVVDTSGKPLREAVEGGVYLIKPNIAELGQLFERRIEGDAEIEAAARELIDRGNVEVVVVSLGAGGAMLVTAEGNELLRSPTAPIVSKVGAGDSMVAGLVLALQRGLSVGEAARFGVAAGAAAVMTPGTQLCRREDTERLFRQMR